ncbi:MAG: flagellar biosynthetic protein FliO [Myxococcaceae bacterium]|nr:flagellar biosynthetic protein FliO [Myxococcaceae bacterium]
MARWLSLTLALQAVIAFADGGSPTQDAGGVDVAALIQPGLAEEPQIPVSEPPELLKDTELDLGWSLVKTFVVLGLVVAIAWLTLNVGLRKLLGVGAPGRLGIISVLERVPLDQKRTLYVVRAGDEVLLLGASDLSVNFLSRLDPKLAEAATPRPAATPGPVTLSPFLQKLLGKKDAPPPPPAT